MSDSTIDDALRLLEIGKGNPDRLKQIIESFQKRSMISMQDRKYVDALVEQYLTPRHRQMTSKMKPSDRQKTNFPRIRKTTESSFKITEVKATSENPYIKPRTETKNPEPQKEELASKEPTIEEKFIEHVEADNTITKKSGKGKLVGIAIGIIAVIIIVGGTAYMGSSSELFSTQPDILAAVGSLLAEHIANSTTLLAGAELGGIPLVTTAGISKNLPCIFIRNQKKEYGTAQKLEGTLSSTDCVVIVEDVATTGGQVLEAAATIEESGATIDAIIAVIDRQEGARENIESAGYTFISLFTSSDLGITGVATK